MENGQNPIFEMTGQRVSASELLEAVGRGEAVRLQRCTISGDFDINLLLDRTCNFGASELASEQPDGSVMVTLPQTMSFDNCRFEQDVVFAADWSGPDSVKVVFKRDVSFNSSVFDGQTRFCSSTFCGSAGFDGCRFERIASFRKANFKSSARLRTADFSGYCLFNDAAFHRSALFGNTRFGKGGNFSGTVFVEDADFAGAHSASKAVPIFDRVRFEKKSRGADETFWRFAKGAAQEAGYYQLAGESFYKERCGHLCFKFRGGDYDRLSRGHKFLRILAGFRLFPEFVFGRLLFGYGERPVRVLVASGLIVFLCGLFYFHLGMVLYHGELVEQSFMDSLYFSTITFTTLGFGDFHPGSDGLTRFVAMAEATSGVCLLALFVVGLAKRFSRG